MGADEGVDGGAKVRAKVRGSLRVLMCAHVPTNGRSSPHAQPPRAARCACLPDPLQGTSWTEERTRAEEEARAVL